MLYTIPKFKLNDLNKKLKRITNAGGTVNVEIKGEENVESTKTKGLYIPCYIMEVSGDYKHEGWEFIGTLEHTPNGNIIRVIKKGVEVPERYRTAKQECEHCHTNRDRKDTYLVYNENTGEFKQVGKSCLKGYTGLSAAVCAMICDFDSYMQSLDNDKDSELGFGGFVSGNGMLDGTYVKKIAYDIVSKEGYISTQNSGLGNNSTVTKIYNDVSTHVKPKATDEDIKKVTEWVLEKEKSQPSSYILNASTAWKLDYVEYRHLALIGSLINSYLKDVEKQKRQDLMAKSSQEAGYVGNVNDKVTFKVASLKTLYSKGSYAYHAPEVYVYQLLDEEGHIYIWSTSTDIKVGDIITAKVKEHKEYRGQKQTVITRGSVVEHSNKQVEPEIKSNPDDEIGSAIDMLYSED